MIRIVANQKLNRMKAENQVLKAKRHHITTSQMTLARVITTTMITTVVLVAMLTITMRQDLQMPAT